MNTERVKIIEFFRKTNIYDLPWEIGNYILIILLWVLLTRLYNGGFSSRLYMTNYINNIPNLRNNIFGRGNTNNNTKYNMFHSYIYLTLPLNKEGIL